MEGDLKAWHGMAWHGIAWHAWSDRPHCMYCMFKARLTERRLLQLRDLLKNWHVRRAVLVPGMLHYYRTRRRDRVRATHASLALARGSMDSYWVHHTPAFHSDRQYFSSSCTE
jgi:hypothetical protein